MLNRPTPKSAIANMKSVNLLFVPQVILIVFVVANNTVVLILRIILSRRVKFLIAESDLLVS